MFALALTTGQTGFPRGPAPWSAALATALLLLVTVLSGGCGSDDEIQTLPAKPTVVAVTPADGATEVLRNAVVEVAFSAPMDGPSVEAALTLDPIAAGQFNWSSDGQVLTFEPDNLLDGNAPYTLSIGSAARSSAGGAIDGPVVVGFRTESDLAPLVSNTVPESGEATVAVNFPVRITFSRAMDPFTTAAAIQFSPAVTGSVSFDPDGTTATFTPSTGFASFTGYTVTVDAGATAVGGTPVNGAFSFRFTTDDHSL